MHLDPDLHPDERYIPDGQTDTDRLTSSKIEMLSTIGHFVAKSAKGRTETSDERIWLESIR